MFVDDVAILACPETHNPLEYQGTNLETRLQDGVLVCHETETAWRVEEGWVRLVRDLKLGGARARLLRLHDAAPRLHDPGVRLLLGLVGGDGERLRAAAVDRLTLGALPARDAAPARVLEVGTGTGAGLAAVAARLPDGADVELWGVDVSIGMLHESRRRFDRAASRPLREARLLMADAGALPFQDATFDRVLHVGGLSGFATPAAALREMARVARPGAPVVVVERQPDPERRSGLLGALALKALPADADAQLEALVPVGATDPRLERLDEVFVALSFRAP